MALVPLFVPPVAERILIAGYVLAFLFAFRYALRGVTADTHGLEFLAFPLVYNMHLFWGFYNFCLSLAVFLFIFGFVLRFEKTWTNRHTLYLSIFALLLYLSHGLMFVFGFITVLRNRVIRIGIAFLPGLLLFAHYYLFRVNRAGSVTQWPTLRYAASLITTLSPLAALAGPDRFLTALYALMLYGMVAIRLWQLRHAWPRPELLLLALFGVASVFAFPVTASGGTMATPRLVYFPVFVLVAWLAAGSMPKHWAQMAAVASFTIAVGMQWIQWPVYRAYDREMTQLVLSLKDRVHPSGLYMEYAGDTQGPITNFGQLSAPDLSSMALCYLGVNSGATILTNYEGAQDHFPLLFRKDKNPYLWKSIDAPVDGVLALCNSEGKGMCEVSPFGSGYVPSPLTHGPSEARWFVPVGK